VLAFRSHGGRGRLASLTASARGLARSPLRAARVVGWVAASTAARVAAAAACAAALGVDHPWSAALVIVPALELATVISLTPANVGITSAAVTFALRRRDIALGPALSAGIALHLVETCAGIVFGLGGLLLLAEPRLRRRIAAAGALGGAVAVPVVLCLSFVDVR
jgi:uncharacterized membrane protein YbhN (UPF0104 family)